MKSLALTTLIFVTLCHHQASPVINSQSHQNLAIPKDLHFTQQQVLVPKASFTQKGYIQFLRYVVDVPELTDYTFCIWVRSNNLTHNHPLLSYSKHEQERFIRVWISPLGTRINLEILGIPIFSIPVHIVENEWYHICQSWMSFHAAWSIYLNGKMKASGYAPKLKKITIDSGGDLVVGQEYTDFDKGLDDGIEGDVSGFNFVLASTFSDINYSKYPVKTYYAQNSLFKREIRRPRRRIFDDQFFPKDETPLTSEILDPLEPHYPLQISAQQKKTFPLYQRLPLRDYIHKPLGLLLVELSQDCGYLRGAPLSGKGVLVSWTKTQVRVFGGAILKTVPPFCVK